MNTIPYLERFLMKLNLKPKAAVADILICTPDITGDLFKQCVRNVLRTVGSYNVHIIALHNGWDPTFSHAHEINRCLSFAERPLITLDDDTTVEGNWFNAMMEVSLDPSASVVATTVYRKNYGLWSTGALFDKKGDAVMWREPIKQPVYMPCAASCCWLIKKKVFRMNEILYKKYHFDSDFTLSNWEQGYPLVIVPATVFHISGGQMKKKPERVKCIESDKCNFREKWLESGRYQKIITDNWNKWAPGAKALMSGI